MYMSLLDQLTNSDISLIIHALEYSIGEGDGTEVSESEVSNVITKLTCVQEEQNPTP